MTPSPIAGRLDRVIALLEGTPDTPGLVARLEAETTTRRRKIRLLALTVAFDIVFSLSTIAVVVRIHADEVRQRHETCMAANTARLGTRQAFDRVFANIERTMPPNQAAIVDRFRRENDADLAKAQPINRC